MADRAGGRSFEFFLGLAADLLWFRFYAHQTGERPPDYPPLNYESVSLFEPFKGKYWKRRDK